MVYGLVLEVIHHYFYHTIIVGAESLGSMKGEGELSSTYSRKIYEKFC